MDAHGREWKSKWRVVAYREFMCDIHAATPLDSGVSGKLTDKLYL